MPGSGPYILQEGDLKKGESLTLTRRDDWWAENEPWARNTFNFKKINFAVVRDQELEYEKFKAGELDFYRATRAQRWVQDLPREKVIQKGWVKRRKIYNQSPQGISGFVMNMRKPPFDDRRVRLAFAHLFNRERLMEKLFFNQYTFIDSYYPGRDWGSGDTNPKIRFDPDRAEELLWEAGYKTRNDAGYLVDASGKQFEITLEYGSQSWERIWLIVKEDYEEAGIKFNLKLIDPSTLIKKIGERQFNVVFWSFTGLLFPNPETSWRSDLADKPHNNNLPGFKDAKVDSLLEVYDVTLDRPTQKKIIREIDSIIFQEHPYALAWTSDYVRVLFWDRFGHPETYVSRTGDQPEEEIIHTWWFDPEREAVLNAAMTADQAIPQGEVIVKPWG
jgi:microcin C transport system substrate-binding protein